MYEPGVRPGIVKTPPATVVVVVVTAGLPPEVMLTVTPAGAADAVAPE